MTLLGMSFTTNTTGVRANTIYVSDDFNSYYTNAEAGRGCVGKKVDTIYVGSYDCTNLKPGMEIDVSYDKAITTAKGTYQTVKRIDVIK